VLGSVANQLSRIAPCDTLIVPQLSIGASDD
jgi:nucleotide-binding universal stress UspA family protein